MRSLIILLLVHGCFIFADFATEPKGQFGMGLLSCAALSPDGTKFITGSKDGYIRLCDAQDGTVHKTFTGHTSGIICVSFTTDGSRILSGSKDNTVRIWNSINGDMIREFSDLGAPLNAAAISSDGSKVIIGLIDPQALLMDVNSGSVVHTLSVNPSGISGLMEYMKVSSVSFSSDDSKILVGVYDNMIRERNAAEIWNAATGEQIRVLHPPPYCKIPSCSLSPDNLKVIAATWDDYPTYNDLFLWDATTGDTIRSFQLNGALTTAFSKDGANAIIGCTDGTASLLNVSTGNIINTFTDHSSAVIAAELSQNDSVAFTADSQSVRFWDVLTGNSIRAFNFTRAAVHSVAFSHDGVKVLTGHEDGITRLWDAAALDSIGVFIGHRGQITSVEFSSDGSNVLTGSADSTVVLWDATTGSLLRTFPYESSVYSVEFSQDGSEIIAFNTCGASRVWDAANGTLIEISKECTGQHITSVFSYSPDGRTLLTGSSDNTASLSDVESGTILRRFFRHTNDITAVGFSPDGSHVITGSLDGTAMLWDISDIPTTLTPKDTTISFTKSPNTTNFIGDFAPLRVGSEWRYSYYNYLLKNATTAREEDTVRMKINIRVQSSYSSGQDSVYLLAIDQTGVHTHKLYSKTTSFPIVESFIDTICTRGNSIFPKGSYRCKINPFYDKHLVSRDSLGDAEKLEIRMFRGDSLFFLDSRPWAGHSSRWIFIEDVGLHEFNGGGGTQTGGWHTIIKLIYHKGTPFSTTRMSNVSQLTGASQKSQKYQLKISAGHAYKYWDMEGFFLVNGRKVARLPKTIATLPVIFRPAN